MNKSTPWGTNERFSPDNSLINNASIAKALVNQHELDDSKLKQGLQTFVDNVGAQAYASADVVMATTEGELQKAQDRRELNQVESEDRRSLIDDIAINTQVSHGIREQTNRGLFNEAKTLELSNQSHEMANSVFENALELQALKTQEQINNIRTEISKRVETVKTDNRGQIKQKLGSIRDRTALTYQKTVGGNGQMVDARLGTPSHLIESLDD